MERTIPFDIRDLQHMHYGSPRGVEYALLVQNPEFRARIDVVMKGSKVRKGLLLTMLQKRAIKRAEEEREPDGCLMEIIERSPNDLHGYDLGLVDVVFDDDQASFSKTVDGAEQFIFHSTDVQYPSGKPPTLSGYVAKHDTKSNTVGATLERKVRVIFANTPMYKTYNGPPLRA